VLLLSLILPLAGYASAWSNCGSMTSSDGTPSAGHHCQHPSSADLHTSSAGHHHCCGDCCGAIVMAASLSRWHAPRYPAGEFSASLSHPEPKAALDRLDRPPRSPA
jgi:hypothetical protein